MAGKKRLRGSLMKQLMTEWRKFLLEGKVEHAGILMIKPDPAIIAQAQEMQTTLPENGVPWAVRLTNQEEMREYVKNIMKMLGSPNTNPEPERVFHITLGNLTGNPHDSVR